MNSTLFISVLYFLHLSLGMCCSFVGFGGAIIDWYGSFVPVCIFNRTIHAGVAGPGSQPKPRRELVFLGLQTKPNHSWPTDEAE